MSIFTRFRLTEKRKVIQGDKAPVYVFEAVEDDDISEEVRISHNPPLGKMKLRVSNPRAQRKLKISDEFMVQITPIKK